MIWNETAQKRPGREDSIDGKVLAMTKNGKIVAAHYEILWYLPKKYIKWMEKDALMALLMWDKRNRAMPENLLHEAMIRIQTAEVAKQDVLRSIEHKEMQAKIEQYKQEIMKLKTQTTKTGETKEAWRQENGREASGHQL